MRTMSEQPNHSTKAEAIYEAIKTTDVGSDVIIHNTDGSVWAIIKIICKEEEH